MIARLPGTNRYTVTSYGLQVALFYSKVYLRVLRPGWLAIARAPATSPLPLRAAFRRGTAEIHSLCDQARLRLAA